MTSPMSFLSPLLLLISFQLLLQCKCQGFEGEIQMMTTTQDPNVTESSEYVFEPTIDYINKDDIAELLKDDLRPSEIPPFYDEEKLWNTPSTLPGPWKRAKLAMKKMFGLHKTSLAWNITQEPMGDFLIRKAKTFHHYIKYTLLKHPTPNATDPTTQDSEERELDFWRAHYTDWKYFNNLHHEILNCSIPENHWFYRTIMKDGYGVNLDDIPTTTPMEFDIHRMDGFSTNVTLPSTMEMLESANSDEIDPEIRAMITIRPVFEEAVNRYISSIVVPTIPVPEVHWDQPMIARDVEINKLRDRLASFYFITTRNPDEWMDTHEQKQNKKLKKWLKKEEARLLASVEEHVKKYTMDFGPKFNSMYKYYNELNVTSSYEKVAQKEEEDKVIMTTKAPGPTFFEPEFVREAIKESRMANMTMMERWLWEHCQNNTIPWETKPPPTTEEAPAVLITERPTLVKTNKTTEPPPDIITLPDSVLDANVTFDQSFVDKMVHNAHRYMRNLSLFKVDENWHRVSKLMYEAQFTTEFTINYDSAENLFTHKMGNY